MSSPAPPEASVWSSPALALGAAAFALVVIAETGRQPVDNPDTHLELTMIHEGPVLEYGGRDLAFLQWGAAVRHWLMLVLAAQVFLPHPESTWWQLALLPAWLVVLCAALALTETVVAKSRILIVPRLLGVAAMVALLGIVAWLVESDVSGGLTWAMVALGIGVVVFRRRSVAVALVTAQALLLALEALREASSAHDAVASAGARRPRCRARRLLLAARAPHARDPSRSRRDRAARPGRGRRRASLWR